MGLRNRLGNRLGEKLGERARAVMSSDGAEAVTTPARPAGPTAVYARVLDGDSLWLAVTGTDERAALRHEETGQVVEPDNDAPADPAAASYRWHLPSALPDLAEGQDHDVFQLVTLPSGATLRADPLPAVAPMRTPPTRDGRWQLDVRRRESGALVVRRPSVKVNWESRGAAARSSGSASPWFHHPAR
jgi:hypothetical protein